MVLHEGIEVPGRLLPVAEGPVRFRAQSQLHCTMPWDGSRRVILIAFSIRDADLLPGPAFGFLCDLGFLLPSKSAPAAPSPASPQAAAQVPFHRALRRAREVLFLEVFAGRARLSAAFVAAGFSALSLDHVRCSGAVHKITLLDLREPACQQVVLDLLASGVVRYCHLAPPCGTALPPARCPVLGVLPPLWSLLHPLGLPQLRGHDASRVESANILYRFCARVIHACASHGVLWSLENPASSLFWLVPEIAALTDLPGFRAFCFHTCAFVPAGKGRRKCTALWCNFEALLQLQRFCDGTHSHLPWVLCVCLLGRKCGPRHWRPTTRLLCARPGWLPSVLLPLAISAWNLQISSAVWLRMMTPCVPSSTSAFLEDFREAVLCPPC